MSVFQHFKPKCSSNRTTEMYIETHMNLLTLIINIFCAHYYSLPGKPLTESPSDTDIFLHRPSYLGKSRQRFTSSSHDEEDDSGDESESEEEEVSSSVFTSDEEGRSRRRSGSSTSYKSSEESVTVAREEEVSKSKDDKNDDTYDKV